MTNFYIPSSGTLCKLPREILGVAFDNDLTLYKRLEQQYSLELEAAIDAVREVLPELTDREGIERLIQKSREQYKGSLEIFTKEYGINANQIRIVYYQHLIGKAETATFFDMQSVPREGLQKLQEQGVAVAIATHGNPEWTRFTLRQTQIFDYFNTDANLVTKDDVGYGKSSSPRMFEEVLARLGAPDTSNQHERGLGYAMVEDTVENLKYAKELGMTTILLLPCCEGCEDIPDYVDVVVQDIHAAIDVVLESNRLYKTLAPRQAGYTLSYNNYSLRFRRAAKNPSVP